MPHALKARRPDLADQALELEVETYWAAPTTDLNSPAPHLTGGAVDLTLCWSDTNERLWMGSLFDDVSAIADLDHFEKVRSHEVTVSDDEARANRRLLYWVMTDAG